MNRGYFADMAEMKQHGGKVWYLLLDFDVGYIVDEYFLGERVEEFMFTKLDCLVKCYTACRADSNGK